LAVHRDGRAYHIAAERLADGLQAEADAEHGDFGCGLLDQVEADTGLVRRAGPGREHDRVRVCAYDRVGRHLVVAMHDDLGPQLPEVMDEVESEAVVVVDQDNHARGQRFRWVYGRPGRGSSRRYFGGSRSGIGVSISCMRRLISSVERFGVSRFTSFSPKW